MGPARCRAPDNQQYIGRELAPRTVAWSDDAAASRSASTDSFLRDRAVVSPIAAAVLLLGEAATVIDAQQRLGAAAPGQPGPTIESVGATALPREGKPVLARSRLTPADGLDDKERSMRLHRRLRGRRFARANRQSTAVMQLGHQQLTRFVGNAVLGAPGAAHASVGRTARLSSVPTHAVPGHEVCDRRHGRRRFGSGIPKISL